MIRSPLEQFNIVEIGYKYITNSSVSMVVGVGIIVTGYKLVYGYRQGQGYVVPTRVQSVVEMYYEMVYGLVRDNIGEKGYAYFPFLFMLFTYIMVLNLMGMVPYVFSATAHIAVALTMSFGIWLGVTMKGFNLHGINYVSMFMPQGAPVILAPLLVVIEIVSYSARAISLGVRLAANVSAGHLLLAILSGFVWTMIGVGGVIASYSIVPAMVVFVMMGLEIAVAVIQAYVFTLLTCIYVNDAIGLH